MLLLSRPVYFVVSFFAIFVSADGCPPPPIPTGPPPPLCGNGSQWRGNADDVVTLAVGPGGVWAVRSNNQVLYRRDTLDNLLDPGFAWRTVDGGLLTQVDVGDDVVWGITPEGNLTCRLGITETMVIGTSWLTLTTKAIHVSISPNGFLVAINEDGTLFYREGLSTQCADVDAWVTDTDTSPTLKQVSVGRSGIWAVDVNNAVLYRTHSFGDIGHFGHSWEQVDISMISHTCKVNEDNEIWRRDRVTANSPTGDPWVRVSFALEMVDAYDGCSAWGILGNFFWLGVFV